MSAHTYSRRHLALFTVAGLVSPLVGRSGGVRLGVQASCFRDLPIHSGHDAVDELIHAMAECDVKECELSPSIVEPAAFGSHSSRHHASMSSMTPQMMRRELRKWRLRTPMAYFESIGSRFEKVGIRLYAYNYSPDSTFSDEEIDRGFSMAKALGAEILTTAATPELARRIAPFADKHQMVVALSGQGEMNVSPFFRLHVDIGQLVAGNIDPVAYIRDHHADITSLYLADCRKGRAETVVWGQGDAPIHEVLQLLKREGWPIRAYVKCQSSGEATEVDEVKRCVTYARQALA
jgi:hypothetical protein